MEKMKRTLNKLRPSRQASQQQQAGSSQRPPQLPELPPLSPLDIQPPPSPLTPSCFSREFAAQNEGRDSVEVDRERSIPPRYMLHGTKASNAEKILNTGLQTSYGGQEGGASRKMNDPKDIEHSQGVVHGTPSRGMAKAYAEFVDKGNNAVIGFRNVHPESTERDPNSRAGYKVNQSIPPTQVVKIPRDKVDNWPDRLP